LSGGEQQRLSLALAIVGRPEVVFLDEPTAGVDPEGRVAVRRVVTELRARGACVVLTTHELPEAERVADEVVIIVRGRAMARGSVAQLAAAGGEGGIRFEAPPGLDRAALASALGAGVDAVAEVEPGRYHVEGAATAARLAALAGWMDEHGVPLGGLRAGNRSLEDVYLHVTRRAPERAEAAHASGARRRRDRR
jgi:ABC-2 type transport system ATP-binding protein